MLSEDFVRPLPRDEGAAQRSGQQLVEAADASAAAGRVGSSDFVSTSDVSFAVSESAAAADGKGSTLGSSGLGSSKAGSPVGEGAAPPSSR